MYNHSVELTAATFRGYASPSGGATVTGWDSSGATFSVSSITIGTPTVTMRNNADNADITTATANTAVKFKTNTSTNTISLNSTAKGTLTTPLYNFKYSGSSYASTAQTSNPFKITEG